MNAEIEFPTADDPRVFTSSDLCEDVCTVSDTHDTWYSCEHMDMDGNGLFHSGPTCPIRRVQVAKNALQSISSGDTNPPLPSNACVKVLRKLAYDALAEIANTAEEREFYEGQLK